MTGAEAGASPGVWSLMPRQNGQCGANDLAGADGNGRPPLTPACASVVPTVEQIVTASSAGAALATSGHSALSTMATIASPAANLRFINPFIAGGL